MKQCESPVMTFRICSSLSFTPNIQKFLNLTVYFQPLWLHLEVSTETQSTNHSLGSTLPCDWYLLTPHPHTIHHRVL